VALIFCHLHGGLTVWLKEICSRASSLTHLFFADDSVMLMIAHREEARVLKEILCFYENCSRQCINREKSSLLFSANTE
jgi:hypothetical protein